MTKRQNLSTQQIFQIFRMVLTFVVIHITFVVFAQIPMVSSGQIKRHENFASQYVKARNIDVWLPEGYQSNKKYSVLYMHDGQMLFDSTKSWNKQEWGVDEITGKLIAQNRIKSCIVVGIWNGGDLRRSEYFPQKPFESLTTLQQDTLLKSTKNNNLLFATKIQSDNYLKFIVTELKPFIDKNYSTYTNKKNTFIAGSSMGGLISMYAICEYPTIFGGAACLSTHWIGTYYAENNPIPDAFMKYLKENLPRKRNHKIYFDYGTETLDAFYPPFQKQADQIMRQKGFKERQWITKKFVGKDHSEKAWRERFDIPLLFLLGK
jgi:predicted alpha/beta superfamily hydrolase